MQRDHKIAIARIFSDLIKADRIIDTGEMEYWEMVCAKYAIDKEIKTEAQYVSFSDALESICNSGAVERLPDVSTMEGGIGCSHCVTMRA